MTGRRFFWSTIEDSAPLVDYTTFNLIYSLRLVNPDYASWAIRLFRDSDSDQEEFNFSSGELPFASIASWASGTTARLQELPNQGVDASRDQIYASGTGAILYQSSAFIESNGKVGLRGVSGAYNLGFQITPSDSYLTKDRVLSSVFQTQGASNNSSILLERGTTSSNRVSFASDTTANKYFQQNAPTGSGSNGLLIAQASQNQQRQHSQISYGTASTDTENYYNGTLQSTHGGQAAFAVNYNLQIMGTPFGGSGFTGIFQEFSLKRSTDSGLRADLETEQNNYYGIY